MDINKIFGMFNSKNEKEEGDFPAPDFLKVMEENHPRYFLGMFEKLINNHLSYQRGLIEMFKSSDSSLDMKDIERAGENLLFNRAWEHINKFNIKDEYSQEILAEKGTEKFEKAVNSAIIYFENEEEYEKCAFLKKFLDFCNSPS